MTLTAVRENNRYYCSLLPGEVDSTVVYFISARGSGLDSISSTPALLALVVRRRQRSAPLSLQIQQTVGLKG